MSEIEQLQQLLRRSLLGHSPRLAGADETATLERLAAARQALAPPRGRHALPRVAQGVLAFRLQRSRTPYPDLKYACYGIARPTDWEGRLLVDDAQLVDELLATVDALQAARPRQFAACCGGLQQAWATDLGPDNEPAGPTRRQNREKLRQFLARHLAAG